MTKRMRAWIFNVHISLIGALFLASAAPIASTQSLAPHKRTTVPFKLEAGEYPGPIVEVMIAGKRFSFLLDSGACITGVSPELAKKLGLTPLSKVTGHGAGAKDFQAAYAKIVSLHVGDVVSKDVTVAIAEMPQGAGYDGIVGMSVLRHHCFTIDFRKQVLSFD